MDISYDSLLSSKALLSFFGLKEEDGSPKELFIILDRIKTRHFGAGETIIREGDQADVAKTDMVAFQLFRDYLNR